MIVPIRQGMRLRKDGVVERPPPAPALRGYGGALCNVASQE
jgi:hypothetical protein